MNHEKHEIHENRILYKEEVYKIQGAIFKVYNEMGCGFQESVYQECVEREMHIRGIKFESQKNLYLNYKGELLNQTYKPDIICYDKIIIELKAVKNISDEHRAQVFNYLRASNLKLGLLVNFGHYPKVLIERIII